MMALCMISGWPWLHDGAKRHSFVMIRIVCSHRPAASLLFPNISSRLCGNYKMGKIDTPHRTKGDPQPPLQKELLRLYSMRFCPYAQRAILVLDAKNIPYDTVNANLTVKPDWLFEKSDGGKVPAIEFEDGKVLSESLIIADYLNEAYPDPPLYPADPLAKAQEKLWIEKFSNAVSAFYKMITGGWTEENLEALVVVLERFEAELARRGTKFFGGSQPGMLDLMIWPWVERSELLVIKGGSQFELPKARLNLLLSWKIAMAADPIVIQSALPAAVHKLFLDNRKNGVYDFDFSSHL